MLIGTATAKLDIPGEAGEWVEIRKLNHKTLAKAAQMKSEAGISSMKALGAELLTALRQAKAEITEAVTAPRVTADAYDRDLVLQAGIVRWSYLAPISPETLGDLDEATAHWLADEIVARSVAPISKEEQGNATAPSMPS